MKHKNKDGPYVIGNITCVYSKMCLILYILLVGRFFIAYWRRCSLLGTHGVLVLFLINSYGFFRNFRNFPNYFLSLDEPNAAITNRIDESSSKKIALNAICFHKRCKSMKV